MLRMLAIDKEIDPEEGEEEEEEPGTFGVRRSGTILARIQYDRNC